MKKTLLFLILVFGFSVAYSQTNLDSLNQVWEDIKQTDSLRIKAYHKYISTGYMFSKPDCAFIYAGEPLNFAQKNNYRWAIANTLHLKEHVYYVNGNFQMALDIYFQSLEFRNQAIDKREMVATLEHISIIYKEQANYL